MGKIYCAECGTELEDTDMFCSSCGTPVDNNNKTDDSNDMVVNGKSANDNSIETKEKSKKTLDKKYIVVGIIAIIIIAILGFVIVTVTSPLYSAGYTVDTSDYSIHSDKSSTPTFDREFTGSNVRFYENGGDGEIEVWHHNAHGNDVDYYLKQYGTYDKDTSGTLLGYNDAYGVKIKHTDDITVDNTEGYIMDGTWGLGCEYTWVILVHNNEYYLICFDGVNQEHQDKFLDSFKFKDN